MHPSSATAAAATAAAAANTINGRYAVAKVNCAPQWESKRRTSDLQHALLLHGYGYTQTNWNSFKSVPRDEKGEVNGGAVMADRRIIALSPTPGQFSRPHRNFHSDSSIPENGTSRKFDSLANHGARRWLDDRFFIALLYDNGSLGIFSL